MQYTLEELNTKHKETLGFNILSKEEVYQKLQLQITQECLAPNWANVKKRHPVLLC
jgi:hypothetical protein